jgi:hypothetical protein
MPARVVPRARQIQPSDIVRTGIACEKKTRLSAGTAQGRDASDYQLHGHL